jgi:hypothetical protein
MEIKASNQRFVIATMNLELKFLADTFQYDAVGMNFLIELLNHAKLEIRAIAYKLLQNNVNFDKIRKIISKGIQLNPGDRVYSIYRLGIQFDDQEYYLCPPNSCGFYEDYQELTIEEYEYAQPYNPNIRLSSHIFQEEAEAIADFLYNKAVQNKEFGFTWKKGNPDFQAKEWCLAKNIPYRKEWEKLSDLQLKWQISDYLDEIEDFELEWEFQDTQNWLGSPAFVREEIIQKQIHLLPEFEELRRKIELSILEEKLELLPKVLQYDEAGINYLIAKIYGFQLEVGKKAYEILLNEFENNDFDDIPF